MAEPIDGGVELEYNNNIYNIIAALIRPLQHVQRCYTIYIYILCSHLRERQTLSRAHAAESDGERKPKCVCTRRPRVLRCIIYILYAFPVCSGPDGDGLY